MTALLEVDGLSVQFATRQGWLTVVEDVGFTVSPREVVGLVGESGSGKTVSALSVMGLLPRRSGRISSGSIRLGGRDLTSLPHEAMRAIRGNEISMIFQEPMTSLNPAYTVGNQIAETVKLHRRSSRRESWSRAVEMLELVGIPDPNRRAHDYPHAFSGGMRQRAMIAMALACEPKLLIADEPTTALDVTIQAQVLTLLRDIQERLGLAVLFVTHDLGVVADICDRVVVMYAGQVVEHALVDELFRQPRHPYTAALLASLPQVSPAGVRLAAIDGTVPRPDELPAGCRFAPRCLHALPACRTGDVPLAAGNDGVGLSRCIRHAELKLEGTRWPPASGGPAVASRAHAPLLELRNVTKEFPAHSGVLRRVTGHVHAVSEVSLTVGAGQTLGLVGESGSGKSTLARLAAHLITPTSGSVLLDGHDVAGLRGADLRRARRDLQIVFQDPYSSLDPRATIAETVGEPLEVHDRIKGAARDERVIDLLARVGLSEDMLRRYPHEFSGGQRQRIAIARALALNPRLVVCDEPVSSLDVSTQSQVINLLVDLQQRLGLAYLFIAHDLSVVRHISQRIAVMYLGRIVEVGDAEEIYVRPRHPYTEALLSAVPVPHPAEQRQRRRIVLAGSIPSPLDPPSGCAFHTRCPYAMPVCSHREPQPFVTELSTTWCHLHTEGPCLGGRPLSHGDSDAPGPFGTGAALAAEVPSTIDGGASQ